MIPSPRIATRLCALVLSVLSIAGVAGAANAEGLDKASELFLTGKYAEAQEFFALLEKEHPVESAVGQARCQRAVGKHLEAAATLKLALDKHPESPDLFVALAQLAFDEGDLDTCKGYLAKTLKARPDDLHARWLRAEVYRLTGKLDEAAELHAWFEDYYNENNDKLTDPDALRFVGLAAAMSARWNRLADQFDFLRLELYGDAIKMDANYWPALLESGRLEMEKYDKARATKSLIKAIELNPNAAEVHAALAHLAIQQYDLEKAKASYERALTINPRLIEAHLAKADFEFCNFEPVKAEAILTAALEICPTSEALLGRLAAARSCVDGLTLETDGTRAGKIIEEVEERNPHAGRFYETMADALDKLRRWPESVYYFERSVEVMPRIMGPRGKLGLVHMRLGDEEQGQKVLEESFDIDPFNVRVKNTLEVLEVLAEYEVLETDHFVFKYDKKDEILVRHMGQYLEGIYPKLTKQFDFEPADKSLFEIFNDAKSHDGHAWFSARMVGLPRVHTIGACAGKMVAFVSPNAMKQPVNWARVLKHEFVHVLNLQQTNFLIPHWYTEALAVLNEETPRSPEWNEMLARRVPAGEVFNLESINLGFIRPTSSEDWQMAYCQAELYAEYMLDRFGDDALAKLLVAYADNVSTADAIPQCFSIEVSDFEEGYTKHVAKVVAELPSSDEKTMTYVEVERALSKDAENPDLLAEMAHMQLRRKQYHRAGPLVEKALKLKPKHPHATYVQTRLQMVIGNHEGVVEKLEGVLDRENPQENVVRLLAKLYYSDEEYAKAAELYRLGLEKNPGDLTWVRLLARVYTKAKQNEKLREMLTMLAERDVDNATVRKYLARLAIKAEDYAEAQRWAKEATYVEVMDVDLHRMLGEAAVGQDQYTAAAAAYETAIELEPTDLQLRFALADAYVELERFDDARQTLVELLKMDPEFPGADVLLESLPK